MSELSDIIQREELRQANTINLVASENYASLNVRNAVASCFTNKYAEGYPGRRYYGGCEIADELETYCQKKWQEVFQTDYCVNVQPHSGSSANLAVYAALLKPGDKILSMSLPDGGHLSHGSTVSLSGKLYQVYNYGLDQQERINYDTLELLICNIRPKLIIAGASAYSRIIDFAKIRDIVERARPDYRSVYKEDYKPIFMADIAHIAGLVAAGLHPTPFGYADVVTTTTHKTLRGTRGGLIFCKPEYEKRINSAVFPGLQGGPLLHVIAGKAATAEEACTEEFKQYMRQVVANCKAMSDAFLRMGYRVVSGGTDNHLLLLDLTGTGLTGKDVQERLEQFNIEVNKNCIPNDPLPAKLTSGIRIGSAAMTTRGLIEDDFIFIAEKIDKIIKDLQKERDANAASS